MKLVLGVAAAFAGCVAAAQEAATVFMLPTPQSSASPSISKELARLILLQRLAPLGQGPSTNELPEGSDINEVVTLMNRYGKATPSLFGADASSEPRQLVVMLEGVSEEQSKTMEKEFKTKPTFKISNPPSVRANDHLMQRDFYGAGVASAHDCAVGDVVNPLNDQCWSGKSTAIKYNVKKEPQVLKELKSKVSQLRTLAKQGEMETTIILLPSVTETTESKYWSNNFGELRRRESEQAMSQGETSSPAHTSSPQHDVFGTARAAVPACFSSQDSCISGTGNCSGHGLCQNRFSNPDGSDGKEICYTCHCLSSLSDSGSITHWAGPRCSKKDISVPFWLFAGFTLAMVGILSLSIGMLFSVGEEKLPGVIGAGVSRSK